MLKILQRDTRSPHDPPHAIKTARLRKGLSQVALATELGCDDSYVSQLEGGKSANPSWAIMTKLRKAVGLDLNKVVDLANLGVE